MNKKIIFTYEKNIAIGLALIVFLVFLYFALTYIVIPILSVLGYYQP